MTKVENRPYKSSQDLTGKDLTTIQWLKMLAVELMDEPRRIINILVIPIKMYQLFKEIFKYGSFEIRTPFSYNETDFAFRTNIQLDGDIVNYIPNVGVFPNDKAWRKLVGEKFQTHQNNIHDRLIEINGGALFLSRFIDIFLILLNFKPLFELSLNPDEVNAIISGAVLSASLLFRKFLKEKVIGISIQGVFRLVRWYMTMRINRRKKNIEKAMAA